MEKVPKRKCLSGLDFFKKNCYTIMVCKEDVSVVCIRFLKERGAIGWKLPR